MSRLLTTGILQQANNKIRLISSSHNSGTYTLGTDVYITATAPSDIIDGDCIIAIINANYNSPSTVLTPPSGFTIINSVPYDYTYFSSYGSVYYKIANSESGNYTFRANVSNIVSVCMAVFRGTNSSPINVSNSKNANSSSINNITADLLTTTVNRCMILAVGAEDSAGTSTNDLTCDSSYELAVKDINYGRTTSIFYKIQNSAGNTLTPTMTYNLNTKLGIVHIALKPR